MIITFDGPAASGKGTIAGEIAKRLDFSLLDTGRVYRAAAALVANAFPDHPFVSGPTDTRYQSAATFAPLASTFLRQYSLNDIFAHPVRYHQEDFSLWVSLLAGLPPVRQVLTALQRQFVQSQHRLVLDGRDTGTVIAPHAERKFFLTATLSSRADRRWQQLDADKKIQYQELLHLLAQRDHSDVSRTEAPLKPAPDAVVIDTTFLTVTETVRLVLFFTDTSVAH